MKKRIQKKNDTSDIFIQPALEIGKEGDEYEKEADATADKVMRMKDDEEEIKTMPDPGADIKKMPDPSIKKMPVEKIRKMPSNANAGMTASPKVEKGISSTKGNGHSLSPDIQQEMGSKMGADFSGVKIHNDSNAADMSSEIGAKAFTHGNDIYFNKGQYDPSSNKGKHLLAHELTHTVQQGDNIQKSLIQRDLDVPTDYGTFKSMGVSTFDDYRESVKLFIRILFYPDVNKVDATKIGFVQIVKALDESGNPYAIDPTAANRMVPKESKKGAGYATDQLPTDNNPLYSQDSNLAEGQKLSDTPMGSIGKNYRLGLPKDIDVDKQFATLKDAPSLNRNVTGEKIFETAVIAIDGVDKGKYYGSVKWGFKVVKGENGAAPTITHTDITFVSGGMPSENFIQAAVMWNKAKTQGTLQVTANPAKGIKAVLGRQIDPVTDEIDVAQDTKLKFKEPWNILGTSYSLCEELEADGITLTGKRYFVKNSDMKDLADGGETKNLPMSILTADTTLIREKPDKKLTLKEGTRILIVPTSKPDKKFTQIEVLDGDNAGMTGKIKNKEMGNVGNEGDI